MAGDVFLKFLNNLGFRKFLVLGLLVGTFSSLCVLQLSRVTQQGHMWTLADWLINYEVGFVRRGLFGELLLLLPLNGVGLLWSLFAIQMTLYGFIMRFFWRFLVKVDFGWPYLATALGPAVVSFHLWDSGAGFRKEILVYVCLILLITLQTETKRTTLLKVGCSFTLFTIAVFSWETSALFLPTILLIISQNRESESWVGLRKISAIGFSVVAVVGAVLSTIFHGNKNDVISICRALRERNLRKPDLCSGAIEAIGWSSEHTINKVASSFPTYFVYIPLILLALLPIFIVASKTIGTKNALISSLAFTPLFLIVNDYGRWTSMIAFSVLFVIAASGRFIPSKAYNWQKISCVFFYIFAWGLPHYVNPEGKWPILGAPGVILKLVEIYLSR